MNQDRIVIKKNREMLDKITDDLIRLIYKRGKLVSEIGKAKKHLGIKVVDSKRESEVLETAREKALAAGVDQNLISEILKLLIKDSRRKQE